MNSRYTQCIVGMHGARPRLLGDIPPDSTFCARAAYILHTPSSFSISKLESPRLASAECSGWKRRWLVVGPFSDLRSGSVEPITSVRDPLVRSDISLLKNNETRKSAHLLVNGRFTDDHPSSRKVCQQVSQFLGPRPQPQDCPTGYNERGSSSPHIELP